MAFQITALPLEPFERLLQLRADELAAQGVVEVVVDEPHAYPCRVTLEDAAPGERVLLFNYPHHAVDSPYAASGPIIVRRQAEATRRPGLNEVPDQQRRRLLSVRAYDARGWIVAADVTPGTELEQVIGRLFGDPKVEYLHLHNARHGCYSARVDRAG
jgi:hypothetical protein